MIKKKINKNTSKNLRRRSKRITSLNKISLGVVLKLKYKIEWDLN